MRRFVFLTVLFFSFAGLAEETSEPAPLFKVENTGSSLHMVFPDGREAELMMQITRPLRVPIRMYMVESLCPHVQKMPACSLNIPAAVMSVTLGWTKHPDAKRLNQVVQMVNTSNGQTSNLINPLNFIVSIDSQQLHQISMPKATLVCDDNSWLEAGSSAKKWSAIATWSGESNSTNAETLIDENQASVGAFDLQLTKTFGAIYRIENGLHFSQVPGLQTPLFGTGPSVLVTRDQNHEFCQSSFMVDMSKARLILQKLIQTSLNGTLQKPSFVPAISLAFPEYQLGLLSTAKDLVFE